MAKARCTYIPRVATFYGDSSLPCALRASLTVSLVGSALLAGAELWLRRDTLALQKLNALYMRPRRQVAGGPRRGHVEHDDADCCEDLGHASIDMAVTIRPDELPADPG